jgi:hypothetical protein
MPPTTDPPPLRLRNSDSCIPTTIVAHSPVRKQKEVDGTEERDDADHNVCNTQYVTIITIIIEEGDSKGWSAVLATALGENGPHQP